MPAALTRISWLAGRGSHIFRSMTDLLQIIGTTTSGICSIFLSF
jgi:hypothetical protein